MNTVRSGDGTTIAYETSGRGAPLILVDGALCHREMGPCRPLAERLAEHFTVITYDRRGRGGSSDTLPYETAREVEDIAALVGAAGGEAYVCGISSGGALALAAAARVKGIRKVAVYEAPFIVDADHPALATDHWALIADSVASARPGEAVKTFMRMVGAPGFFVLAMRLTPTWRKLSAVAHTLPYDGALVAPYQRGEPLRPDAWRAVTAPTLVVDGGKSPPWMRNGMRALADALPNAQRRTLPGQNHMVKRDALAPVLVEFFASAPARLTT